MTQKTTSRVKHLPNRIQQAAPPQNLVQFTVNLNVTYFIIFNVVYPPVYRNIKNCKRNLTCRN
jgi:hypothetical protein